MVTVPDAVLAVDSLILSGESACECTGDVASWWSADLAASGAYVALVDTADVDIAVLGPWVVAVWKGLSLVGACVSWG